MTNLWFNRASARIKFGKEELEEPALSISNRTEHSSTGSPTDGPIRQRAGLTGTFKPIGAKEQSCFEHWVGHKQTTSTPDLGSAHKTRIAIGTNQPRFFIIEVTIYTLKHLTWLVSVRSSLRCINISVRIELTFYYLYIFKLRFNFQSFVFLSR